MIITSCFISDKLADCADLMAQRRSAFFESPDDIEMNHKFRVSIRTTRSLVSFLEPWLSRKQCKAIQANLKRVVKETSRLRELDVFMSQAESLDPAAPELVAFCSGEAAQERERVLSVLSATDMMDRLDAAIKELHDLSWKASIRDTGLDPAYVRIRYDKLVDNLNTDLDTLDNSDYELMHSIRKRTKQARYVAEQFSELIGKDVVGIAKDMKARQDDLGALCDAKINRELVGSYLVREDVSETLAREIVRLI
jgi:CHAD domain-containing protein